MAYKRPPITEAIIELRFAHPASDEVVKRAAKTLFPEYFYQDNESGRNFMIDAATGKTETDLLWSGVKLSSPDRADSIMLRTAAFAASRLAPYMGWEQFRDRVAAAWGIWRKVAGPFELARIGVRYVNRIDVPVAPDQPIRLEDYLNLNPRTPDDWPAMGGFTMQVIRPIGADDCMVVLNSATVVPPMLGFYSFLLDLDVSREISLPRRDDELWTLLDKIRHHKNAIFESCITDRTRALFDQ